MQDLTGPFTSFRVTSATCVFVMLRGEALKHPVNSCIAIARIDWTLPLRVRVTSVRMGDEREMSAYLDSAQHRLRRA